MDFIQYIGFLYVFAMLYAMAMVNKKPDLSFWLMINLYFDPGGYLSYVLEPFLGRLDYQDILIVFILISISHIKFKIGLIKQNVFLIRFLRLFIFFLIFYIFIYGALVPYLHDDYNFSTFLLKNRRFLYGIILLFGVYFYTLRGLKYLSLSLLFTALPTLIFYWITLVTNIKLIQMLEFARYKGEAMMRLSMLRYGLINLVFPVFLIVFFVSQKRRIKIHYRKLLYFTGSLMLITLLVTLSRRVMIDIVGSFVLIIYFVSKIIRIKIVTVSRKTVFAVIFIFILLFSLKPEYIKYVSKITEDAFMLVTTGHDTRGMTEQRVSGTGIYMYVFNTIFDNIWLGTGYTYFHWEYVKKYAWNMAVSSRGLEFGQLADAAQEIPIVNLFFSFGVVGFLLLLPLYWIIIKTTRKLYKLLRKKFEVLLLRFPLYLVFSVLFIYTITKLFTYNLWSIGGQFIGETFQLYGFWFGLGFGLLAKVKMILINEK